MNIQCKNMDDGGGAGCWTCSHNRKVMDVPTCLNLGHLQLRQTRGQSPHPLAQFLLVIVREAQPHKLVRLPFPRSFLRNSKFMPDSEIHHPALAPCLVRERATRYALGKSNPDKVPAAWGGRPDRAAERDEKVLDRGQQACVQAVPED
ncbi:hypothetical protein BC936DRAFT_142041 [Jimgerdemannia flammicorona]|uniref:Uncharacterized protein n=1 Tax=Jimgerdemannia flammicorona TaxID=994334 RepID=A0A433A1B4_9FUNG|nr:hypothetical protein BC936DRAFT_142041 [Jimgerdemannia flammicorona]